MEGSRGHGSKEVRWNSSSPIIFILGSTKTRNHSFRQARPGGHATWNSGEGLGRKEDSCGELVTVIMKITQ